MIGRHPDVAMLYEDFGRSVRSLVGKPVVGNKLCVPNQIEMSRRRPRWVRPFGPRLFHALHRRGYFDYRPVALTSIEDYLRWEPLRLVGIVREGSSVVSSIMQRGGQSQDVATHRWTRGIEILDELKVRLGDALLLISFDDLVSSPEETMHAVARHIGLPFDPAMLEGYAYTPHYSNRKIDAAKATGPDHGALEATMQRQFPEAYAAYRRLRSQSSFTPPALREPAPTPTQV